jgi:hypothetical protein
MALPNTLDDLKAAGWVFKNTSTCKGCGEDVEWWDSPTGSHVPLNPMPRGTSLAVQHRNTCTNFPSR